VAKGAMKDPKPHSGLGVIRAFGGRIGNFFSPQIDNSKPFIQALLS
jgi:hypothetical protein